MSDLTAGPAVECTECGEITPVSKKDLSWKQEECPQCDGYATRVTIETCDLGDDCQDQNHHFGTGVHVIEEQQ